MVDTAYSIVLFCLPTMFLSYEACLSQWVLINQASQRRFIFTNLPTKKYNSILYQYEQLGLYKQTHTCACLF